MAQQLDYPKNENELRKLQDDLFQRTKEASEKNELSRFKGLLEYITAETTILTAIHNIKSNKGSQTPGSDGRKMRENILEQNYTDIIPQIQNKIRQYQPEPVKRAMIPKPGKEEKRPLGIPTITDRIIQECVRMIIEPILEAQFFKHSYGFRPMRDAHMAIARTSDITHLTGYHWIIEGDISKFFDTVNHTKLIKKLWHMGIRDQRVLMIIKAMLKAGIMDELKENPLGTPQGGIISPLLANAYLDTFDQWIIREWEEKETRYNYVTNDKKIRAMKKNTKLKPAYLVRYADDWVLITSTKSNAEKWKKRIKKYLDINLKLTLSDEKTKITNIKEKPIHFLGFNIKKSKGKSRTGYITNIRPNPEKLKEKVKKIQSETKKIKKINPNNKRGKEKLINEINRVNSIIRGVINYYEAATWVNVDMKKYADNLKYTAFKTLKPYGGKWIPANEVNNLPNTHKNYKTKIPTITYEDKIIGITSLNFCKWKRADLKKPAETPYTDEGRKLYQKRRGKAPIEKRADELFTTEYSEIVTKYQSNTKYNMEYYLNRPYAFNRDKGKCRVCGTALYKGNFHTHHIKPKLNMNKVNRVNNLASVCIQCHKGIHNNKDLSVFGEKIWNKILKFREKLDETV